MRPQPQEMRSASIVDTTVVFGAVIERNPAGHAVRRIKREGRSVLMVRNGRADKCGLDEEFDTDTYWSSVDKPRNERGQFRIVQQAGEEFGMPLQAPEV